jgi:two-component system, OmpR family, sensor histidine kinase TctE
MRWNPIPRATLRARLLGVLVPGLVVLLAISLWLTHGHAVRSANTAFDRSLLGALRGLDLNVSSEAGGLSVEQPFRLFEFFELTASGAVHYRVATDDGLVEIGSPDLPLPTRDLVDGQAQFYDAVYLDEPVRVGALARPLDPPLAGARRVVIQVAEPADVRSRFVAAFIRQTVTRDALVLGLLALAVVGVSAWALRPVQQLAQSTRERDPQDMGLLPTADLPRDLVPLVEAINTQVAHTSTLLEQRRRFLDDASHQLRTPLTTLRAQLDYVLRETDPQRARDAIGALSRELDHATRATHQLLLLARADEAPLACETFDLAELAREVALELLPLARAAGVDFGVDAGEQALPASGDRGQLREALSNLVHNALVHGAGPVTIEVAGDPQAGWSLGVVDAGPGLAPEVAAQPGARFAKGRGSRGSGLGLALAKAVVERHGGALQLSAGEAGRGLRAMLVWRTP